MCAIRVNPNLYSPLAITQQGLCYMYLTYLVFLVCTSKFFECLRGELLFNLVPI